MKLTSLGVLLAVLVLQGCTSAPTITTDFDPEYDLTTFKTYRWASGQEINPQDELVKNPLIYKRIKASVNRALEANGAKEVEGDDFDFVVLAHAGLQEKMNVTQTGGGGGYYGGYGGWYDPWWGPYGGTTQVSYYEEATLVIDIIAWEQKELAWRGMATGTVKEHKDQESMQQRIDEVIDLIFAEYPPGSAAQ